jgi:hypothetical protein
LGRESLGKATLRVKLKWENIRAADAKEVGVGNPAEETYCYPNVPTLTSIIIFCQPPKNTLKLRVFPMPSLL